MGSGPNPRVRRHPGGSTSGNQGLCQAYLAGRASRSLPASSSHGRYVCLPSFQTYRFGVDNLN